MYINRAKALLLVGTIAAGCVSGCDDEGSGDGGTAGTAGTAGGGAGGTAGGGTGGTPTAGSAGQGGGGSGGAPSGGAGQGGGGSGGGASGGTSSNGGSASEPDAGYFDAGPFDASSSDSGTADAGGDAGPLACLDSADTAVGCADLGPEDCPGEEGFLSVECEMVAFNLKPAPANYVQSCMIELNPPDLCDEDNTYQCILVALEASCTDPEAEDECVTIGNECDNSPEAFGSCVQLLSGMTQDGRDRMVQCMILPTCDLVACVEALDF